MSENLYNKPYAAQYNITTNRVYLWCEKDNGKKLSPEDYEKVKHHRMQWWHRGCFTTLWSPDVQDLIEKYFELEIEQCDEPEDHMQRIERYQKYADRAETDAAYAQNRLQTGAANTARRIRMTKHSMDNNYDKADYWNRRIAGSIATAQYRERPDVIVRRIQGLEKDLRKHQAEATPNAKSDTYRHLVEAVAGDLRKELGITFGELGKDENGTHYGYSRKFTAEEIEEYERRKAEKWPIVQEYHNRWIRHLEMRLQYERAYLEAVGGDPRDKTKDLKMGDRVKIGSRPGTIVDKPGPKNVLVKFDDYQHAMRYGREDITEVTGEVDEEFLARVKAAEDARKSDGIKKGAKVVFKLNEQDTESFFGTVLRASGTRVVIVDDTMKDNPDPRIRDRRKWRRSDNINDGDAIVVSRKNCAAMGE